MASTYKTLLNNDIVSTQTLLHEAIPVTGTIVSGTYNDLNIKTYAHGMFESVFDYPYLSSSSNHIFDLTVGYSANSSLSKSEGTSFTTSVQNAKKINIYNEMAQILVGYDATGSIREFDRDGDLTGGSKIKEAVFINVARLLTKDEIKKQSFSLTIATGGVASTPELPMTLQDHGARDSYKANSPAGEYGILYTASTTPLPSGESGLGLIYYQAGIIVLTASVFGGAMPGSTLNPSTGRQAQANTLTADADYFGLHDSVAKTQIDWALSGSSITGSCDGLRSRLVNMSFNNTTELNSTVYFCRANNNEFNYSSNPTYLSSSVGGRSQIRVKNNTTDLPVSFITSIGLYSSNNELLASAKLSEPLRKDPNNEFTLRVRLDY